jgi:hypothetical protein
MHNGENKMNTEYKDTKTYTKLPFKGVIIGSEPEVVVNPYSQVEVTLTPTEVAMYDITMGSYHMGLFKDFYKGKNWFIDNNPEAYFDLID